MADRILSEAAGVTLSNKIKKNISDIDVVGQGVLTLATEVDSIQAWIEGADDKLAVVPDTAMSATSENSVQNKAVKSYVDVEVAKKAAFSVAQLNNNKHSAEFTHGNDAFHVDTPNSNLIDIKWVNTDNSVNVTAKVPTMEYVEEKVAEAMDDAAQEHFHVVEALPDPLDPDLTKRPEENHEYVLVTYEQDGTTIESETHYLFYDGSFHLRHTPVSLDGYATETYVDTAIAEIPVNELATKTEVGDLSSLGTTANTNIVSAINEVKFGLDGLGEPFRVKQWASTFNVSIEPCTTDLNNQSLAKMTYSIDAVEGADYQICGLLAYEVFDAATGGNRINCWPVCQFTGNGQKELSVRWVCAGTTAKTAKRINGWVLLKHR